MDRYCIVVPSIRDGIWRFREMLYRSLTLPSDVLIADGSEGLIQTYAWALDHFLDIDRHSHFVKIDDDVWLNPGWQDRISAAFRACPSLGALSLDLSMTEFGKNYMGEIKEESEVAGIKFKFPVGNIGGAFIAMMADTAKAVGSPPVVEGTKYQIYEDYWRCQRVRGMGLQIAYLNERFAKLNEYQDSDEYLNSKQRDTTKAFEERALWETK